MVKTIRFLTVLVLVGGFLSFRGMGLYPVAAEALQQETITLTGWLNLIYGDPPPDSNLPPRTVTYLSDASGIALAELVIDENTARAYTGQLVEVTGQAALSSQGADGTGIETIVVETVVKVEGDLSAQDDVSAAVAGAQPFVNVLCRFPDIASTPHDSAWYANLMRTTYPGLDHYWRQISYNTINLTGTTTIADWVTLPKARAFYLESSGNANLGVLAQDCIAAADSLVNFPQYVGINMMFNASLGCCAWGGLHTITTDGQTKTYRTSWMADWIDVAVLAHEMGHGFGLPHSSGPSWDPPEELNIYVSAWDMMSSSWGTGLIYDPDFGFIPPGTITYHLDIAGWLPSGRKTSVLPGQTTTVTLERLRLPVSGTNPLMAKVLIGGSNVRFYTVEARMLNDYDQNTPGNAVIIHDVDITRTGNAGHALVVDNDVNHDVNDDGAMWTVGETFTDANNITISVLSAGASSFTVQIINNSPPQLFPDAPTNIQTTNMTATNVSLSWQDNSYNEAGFRIYYWIGEDTFTQVGQVGANITTFTNTGLACGTERYYLVASYNNNPVQPNPNPAPYGVSGATFPCKPPLTAPPNGSESSTGRPTLTWDFVGNSALTYEVYLDTSNPPSTLVAITDIPTYQPPAVLPAGLYYWQIRALNYFGGISPLSDMRNFLVVSPVGAAPNQNYFTTGTPLLTWNRISWAVAYEIRVDGSNPLTAPYQFSATVPASQLSASVTPALTDGTYYMQVRAQQADGTWGSWSTPASFVVAIP